MEEDFSAIYLRKIASEFADDLDKVREAQDFKASSVEEKGRVVGAASS
jgi:ribosome assembly protein 3